MAGASVAFACARSSRNDILDAAGLDAGRAGRGGTDTARAGLPPQSIGDAGEPSLAPPDAGGGAPDTARHDSPVADGGTGAAVGSYGVPPFVLKAEWTGPCVRADRIDVNRGHTAETFVRAAHCQIKGTEPAETVLASWAARLRTREYVRRVDVVKTFCNEAGRADSCPRDYSDPWQAHPLLEKRCQRTNQRDIGAVLMFWSNCPGRTNCEMDWANTHSLGMQQPDPLYGSGPGAAGYYHPDNVGWWRRELLEARHAGLQFLLLNSYGPDISRNPGRLELLVEALELSGRPVGIALFDDTWYWGRPNAPAPWDTTPNLADTEQAAQTLYNAKWRTFFRRVPRTSWYLTSGRPLIYFYNAGTLVPREVSAAVIARMKVLFRNEFGVEPFVAVDSAYFSDRNMGAVADARFLWSTLGPEVPQRRSRSTIDGFILDHYMVKWDDFERDTPDVFPVEGDRLYKGPMLLEMALQRSVDASIMVIATWNDLGEGTGIQRNYDYYYRGEWLTPDRFMQTIRSAQCQP